MFQLISDGSCDHSSQQIQEAGIAVVPLYISLDGSTYLKEAAELDVHDFYEYCVTHPGIYPRTSSPNIQDYLDVFERCLSQGSDILCYCITSKFSGSFDHAAVAKEILMEQYPDRKIIVADSTLATGLQGLLLLELSRYAKEGHTLEETFARGEEIKQTAAIYFTIGDLSYLAKGGRIGHLTNMVARDMRMKPLIRFGSGEIHPIGIAPGRKISFKKTVGHVRKVIQEQGIALDHYSFALGWGYDRSEAEPFFEQIKEMFLELFGSVPEFIPIQIGATIGVHTGPYPVGIGMIEKA